MRKHYDVIIIGAGSAGGVLAGRLSEASTRSVLVLEAGPVYTSAHEMPDSLLEPSNIGAAAPGNSHNWPYLARMRPGLRMPYVRGRGIGGSSSINGCSFIRGLKDDFDRWAQLGNHAWSYDRVLPSFIRGESDLDVTSAAHGTDGPIPVHRECAERSPEFTEAFEHACKATGFVDDRDKNDPRPGGGVGPVPTNIRDGRRYGTALGYLIPAMSRDNLDVVGDAVARRVILDGTRAVGVDVVVDGHQQVVHGREIILSAGALRTPHLLMLSGIGSAAHLREHGIDVVQDLPGVGTNLTDHAIVTAGWESRLDHPKMPDKGLFTSVLHWADEGSEMELLPFVAKSADMLGISDVLERPTKAIAAMRGTSLKAVTRQARLLRHPALGIVAFQQESRGKVSLNSANPDDMPAIDVNLLDSDIDYIRLRAAARMSYEIFQTDAMGELGARIVDLDHKTVNDDSRLDKWIAEKVGGSHVCCTCRMGPDSDTTAVVDQSLRVHGVTGLRIADTSIFPTIPSRGPNATVMMVGEHLAGLMSEKG